MKKSQSALSMNWFNMIFDLINIVEYDHENHLQMDHLPYSLHEKHFKMVTEGFESTIELSSSIISWLGWWRWRRIIMKPIMKPMTSTAITNAVATNDNNFYFCKSH